MNKDNIIAEGEVTGHAHRASGTSVKVIETQDGKNIVANHPVTITHEEHDHMTIPSGEYEIGIVIEQDHLEETVRTVVD